MRTSIITLMLLASGCSLINDEFSYDAVTLPDASMFDASPDASTADAGFDGGTDSGNAPEDAHVGIDAGLDSGPPCVVEDERCDGIDNDCDESTDEGSAADLGCAWSCGAGACTDPTMVAAGARSTCALLGDGRVACWGDNDLGQLGDGTMEPHHSPGLVPTLSGISAVSSAGGLACALDDSGQAWCWGDNWAGQLGDGGVGHSLEPLLVPVSDVRAIDAGSLLYDVAQFTGEEIVGACAIAGADRSVWCWGGVDRPLPALVPSSEDAIEVAVGAGFACLRDALGFEPRCWGANDFGQLGDGTTDRSSSPVRVDRSGSSQHVAAGARHACALLGGVVHCWGANDNGQCGQPASGSILMPAPVAGLTGVNQFALGFSHSCALLGDGRVFCWGRNANGQLGNGSTTPSAEPVQVNGLEPGAVAIAAGFAHTCAVLADGTLACWGQNSFGQLGDGTTTQRTEPVLVLAIE